MNEYLRRYFSRRRRRKNPVKVSHVLLFNTQLWNMVAGQRLLHVKIITCANEATRTYNNVRDVTFQSFCEAATASIFMNLFIGDSLRIASHPQTFYPLFFCIFVFSSFVLLCENTRKIPAFFAYSLLIFIVSKSPSMSGCMQ